MNNRVDNPGFLSDLAQSGLAKVGQKAALLGALATGFANQVKADTVVDAEGVEWNCGNDVDEIAGTTYNDEAVYYFAGIPGAESTRSVMGGETLTTEFSTNGLDFTDMRAQIAETNPDAESRHVVVTGFSPRLNQTTLTVSLSDFYKVDNFSSGDFELSSYGADYSDSTGAINNKTGAVLVSANPDSDRGIYNVSGSIPVEVYNPIGTIEQRPVIDGGEEESEDDDRLGYMDEAGEFVLVNNLSDTPSEIVMAGYAYPSQYLSADDSPIGKDTWIYVTSTLNEDPNRIKYCYDPASGTPLVVDADADGIPAGTDCDDEVESVGAPETFFIDSDLDGYGSSETTVACPGTPETATNALDCDDADASIQGTVTLFPDSDGDGFGDDSAAETVCPGTPGMTDVPGDCDDTDGTVNPEANEDCDGVDNDCNDQVDEEGVCDTQITPMGSAEIIDGVVYLDQIGDGVSVVIHDGSTLVVDATPYGTHFPVSARGAGSLILGTEATLRDMPISGGAAPTPPPVAAEGTLMLRISPEQTGIFTYTDADGVAHEITYADGVTYVEIPKPTEDTGGQTDGGSTDGGSSDGGTEGDGGSTVQDGGSASQDGGAEKPIENPVEEPDDKGLLGCSTVEGTNGGMWTLATALLLAARRKKKQ